MASDQALEADDEAATVAVRKIPLLRVRAGPRDGPEWIARLKEEYAALISVRPARSCAARGCVCDRSS